jgi:hypothetical protein
MKLWATKELREKDEFGKRETFTLGPGEFVLALTYESIKVPKNLIALVEGRSTYARMGLSMHQTAPWIQPGWSRRRGGGRDVRRRQRIGQYARGMGAEYFFHMLNAHRGARLWLGNGPGEGGCLLHIPS